MYITWCDIIVTGAAGVVLGVCAQYKNGPMGPFLCLLLKRSTCAVEYYERDVLLR
jgi:hypothetical protein